MTVLIYVLSSHEHPYGDMISTSRNTWDAKIHMETRTLFYCGRPVGNDPEWVVSFPVDESYSTMGVKDLLAYRHALTLEWDFMARVNASCYVHKRRLVEHIRTLPSSGVMEGVLAPCNTTPKGRDFMWGGGQYIFSRDVIQMMVDRASQWRHDLMEDVAMTELAYDAGIEIASKGLFCSVDKAPGGWMLTAYNGEKAGGFFERFEDINSLVGNHYYFRVKHDPDRKVDAEVMHQLAAHLLL